MDSAGRDRGLSRISRLTRWSAAGAFGLTGLFSIMVAHARPGAAKAVSTTPVSGPSTPAAPDESPAVTTPPLGGGSILQPPAQLPQPTRGRGVVTSGAS